VHFLEPRWKPRHTGSACPSFPQPSGSRSDSLVSFTKTYDLAAQLRLAQIAYSGAADAALSEFEGTWRLLGGEPLSGGFVMRRLPSAKVEAKRELEVGAAIRPAAASRLSSKSIERAGRSRRSDPARLGLRRLPH
jgi:hypothetical protein